MQVILHISLGWFVCLLACLFELSYQQLAKLPRSLLSDLHEFG